jgi:hypothetical protein
MVMLAAGAALLIIPTAGWAQRCGGIGDLSPSTSKPPSGDGQGGSTHFATPEPYGGQLYCPVTGKKLGLTQPAVAVQTTIGEEQPTWLSKLFHRKGKTGAVIYVCCPECAEKVRANPMFYYTEVVGDKACFTFTYAIAPAQRPPRTSSERDNQSQVIGDTPPNGVQPFPAGASPPSRANIPQP